MVDTSFLVDRLSTLELAEQVSTAAGVTRVRIAMRGDSYKAWRSYNLRGGYLADFGAEETPEQQALLGALEKLDCIPFKDMSSVELVRVFEATCRLLGVMRGSFEHQLLDAELVQSRLAERRTSRHENPEKGEESSWNFAPDLEDVQPVARNWTEMLDIRMISVTVFFFLGFAVSHARDSMMSPIAAQRPAAEVLTPSQVDNLYRKLIDRMDTELPVHGNGSAELLREKAPLPTIPFQPIAPAAPAASR